MCDTKWNKGKSSAEKQAIWDADKTRGERKFSKNPFVCLMRAENEKIPKKIEWKERKEMK